MIVVEILLFLVWGSAALYSFRGRRFDYIAILISAPLFLAPPEILNEVFQGGAYYPLPHLIDFPFFHFPLAILMGGGILALSVHLAAEHVCRYFDTENWVIYLMAVLILALISIPVEFVFTSIGFWRYTAMDTYTLSSFIRHADYLRIYLYTLAYVLPSLAAPRIPILFQELSLPKHS